MELIEENIQRVSDYIGNQKFKTLANLFSELNTLDDVVALCLAKLLVDSKKINSTYVVTFNSNSVTQNPEIINFCNQMNIILLNLDIEEDVQSMYSIICKNFSSKDCSGRESYASDLLKLKNDTVRGILYTLALRTNGIVLSNINKSNLQIGNYTKTSQKVGDWNIIGNLTSKQIIDIAKGFNISQYFFDKYIEEINYHDQKFGIPYESFFDEKGEMLNFNILSSKSQKYIRDNEHKKVYPPIPTNELNEVRKLNVSDGSDNSDKSYEIDDVYSNKDIYESQYELPQQLSDVLKKLRQKEQFSAKKWLDDVLLTLSREFAEDNIEYVVFGLSGGVDSATVASIMNELNKIYPLKKIIAVALPCSSTKEIQERAFEVANDMNITCMTVDLTTVHINLCNKIHKLLNLTEEEIVRHQFVDGCFKSSLRANILYCISRLIKNTIVIGTGNKSEDKYLGYCAKSGDNMVDKSPIGTLYKRYVYFLGKLLGVSKSILNAQPSADLVPNQTDEGELSMSYEFVELYMRLLEMKKNEMEQIISSFDESTLSTFREMETNIVSIHERNKHKSVLGQVI